MSLKQKRKRAEPAPIQDIKGFRVLSLLLSDPSDDVSPACNDTRCIYFKKHTGKKQVSNLGGGADDGEEDSSDRTLFVTNVPSFYTGSDLTEVFSMFGDVESAIVLESHAPHGIPLTKKIGSRSAHIIFEDSSSLETALSTDLSAVKIPFVKGSAPSGISKWLLDYKAIRPDVSMAQAQVDRFMAAFDERTEAEKAARKSGPKVDSEGFTLVSYKKKRKLVSAEDEALGEASKKKSKSSKPVVVNFYKFQERQKKQEQLVTLRKKFEEDKQKLATMKAQRKFKPY